MISLGFRCGSPHAHGENRADLAGAGGRKGTSVELSSSSTKEC